VAPRLQLQAIVSSDGENWFLLNASPDLRFQIESDPELQPSRAKGRRSTPIRGIVLTSADLDQVIGLLLLREFQPITVYATALVRDTLEADSFFRMLHRLPNQLTWVEISAGEKFALGDSGISCTPIPLAGSLPFYAREFDTHLRGQASIGLLMEFDDCRVAYTPSVPEITDDLRAVYRSCDTILVDGTFWSDAELSETHAGTPIARAIGHIPLSGDDGTIALLAELDCPRKVLVHINNTNPILDPQRVEHRATIEAGWEIGYDGWQLAQRL
jgi:pyrroloquinoline quinone biosynthesis protein B